MKPYIKANCSVLQKEITDIRTRLVEVQVQINSNTLAPNFSRREVDLLDKYKKLYEMEILYMKQKAEEEWTLFSDKCLKLFHSFFKTRRNKSAISEVSDSLGNKYRGQMRVS